MKALKSQMMLVLIPDADEGNNEIADAVMNGEWEDICDDHEDAGADHLHEASDQASCPEEWVVIADDHYGRN